MMYITCSERREVRTTATHKIEPAKVQKLMQIAFTQLASLCGLSRSPYDVLKVERTNVQLNPRVYFDGAGADLKTKATAANERPETGDTAWPLTLCIA